jgi:hypothetical protein
VCERLAGPALDSVSLAAEVLKFVEQSGREGAARRERLRQAIGLATEFYQQLLRRIAGVPVQEHEDLLSWVEKAAKHWPGDAGAAAMCVERCLEAAEQVDRNAYPPTLIECWLDDLAHATTPGGVPRG